MGDHTIEYQDEREFAGHLADLSRDGLWGQIGLWVVQKCCLGAVFRDAFFIQLLLITKR